MSLMRALALLCCGLFAFQASAAESADSLFDLSLRELLNVTVVTASKREQTVTEAPAAITVLTSSDLDLLGFNTLHDAMEYALGVSAVSGENNIWHGYSIRGDTVVNYNTKTLLLIDGFRVHNPLFGSFDLTSIPITAIDRVEVIKGARSVMYGSNAVNAVINVITKKPETKQGQLKARAGEFGTHYLAANRTEIVGEWRLSGYIEEHSTDNQTLIMNSERGEQVEFNKWLNNHNITLNAVTKNLQLFGMFHRRAQPNFLTRSFTFVRETDVRANLLGFKYGYEFTPQLTADFQVSRYDWEAARDFFRLRDGIDREQLLTAESYSDEVERRIFYDSQLTDWILELTWSPNEDYLIKLGGAYSDSYGRRFQTNLNDFDIGKFKDKTKQLALYVNAEFQVAESLRGHAGVRWDDYDYRFTGTGDTADFDDISTEASLVWTLSDEHTLKVIYGESFRVPTYFEKEANTASTVGNPDLEPEYSESIDLVFIRNTDRYKWDIGIFRTLVEGNIGRGDAPDGRRQNQNLGESEIVGLESNLRWQFKDLQIYGFGGLGIYEGDGHSNMDEPEQELKFTYDYMLTMGINYEISDRLAAIASFKHLSDWGDAPSYRVFNLGLRAQFNAIPNMEFSLDIKNVLEEDVLLPEVSRDSPEVPFYPLMQERMIQAGATYSF